MAAAIRALGLDIPKPESIGFPNSAWQDIVRRKHGLVLFTGITGAGKSTTIASLIARINENRACRIMTLEDPIEYIFKQKNSMISQREIGRDVDRFSAGLRAMMRQDPDIIFVGEMRDAETVSLTLTAAETGHLVFSTLHTRDAVGTITRILDFFPEGRQDEVRNQLSLGLAYVLSQKLLPRKDARGRVVAMEILNNYARRKSHLARARSSRFTRSCRKTKDQPNERMITLAAISPSLSNGESSTLEAQKWANDENCFIDAMKSEKG